MSRIFFLQIYGYCICSIGSLGAGHSEAAVSNVVVDGARLTGTTNGVRIKTWQVISTGVENY